MLNANATTLESINETFGLGSSLVFDRDVSGLVRGRVKTSLCDASFFLHGAHLASFRPASAASDMIFTSRESFYEAGKPIRGGVPICFPWFGAHKSDANAPSHGNIRIVAWNLESTKISDDVVVVRLRLETGPFKLTYEMRFSETLELLMSVENASEEVQACELALHTYFQLADATRARVMGLESVDFLDQLTKITQPATNQPIVFDQEVDRIYFADVKQVTIDDVAGNRTISIQPSNSGSTVVWNPWIAKSQRLPDFGDNEYLEMCCVETARVRDNQLAIEPGCSETVGVKLGLE